MSTIEINKQFEHVLNFVNQTNQPIFLTGKAGTGKTTLLKYIKENTVKQIAVVAPTGVAAINAGGSTIHSFFQFAFAPFLPVMNLEGAADYSKTTVNFKYNSLRLSILRKLELLVIDEISMVRADLLDQIDFVLRTTRKKTHLPFGGVQVMFIGDMHQLPPVVNHEEWKLLNQIYQSPYFFDSLVIKNNPPVYIELGKIYRQNEQAFIDILNKVRNNNLSLKDLETLNSHYRSDLSNQFIQSNITLTTHNQKADEINQKLLNALPERTYTFKSKVEGIFNEKNFPAEEVMTLKIGTRVMFLKNNAEKNYYNGKIGIVTYLSDSTIKVKCEEDSNEIEVNKEAWTNVSYQLNKQTKVIEEDVLGTFTQYPLRLAWAITIHKSQGLTFEKVIIDAANSFSAGQVYVALSRCRSLSGLTLSSKINAETLYNDKKILQFSSSNKQDQTVIDSIFKSSKNEYIKTILVSLFDLTDIVYSRKDLAGIIQMYKTRIHSSVEEWSESLFSKIDALNAVSFKFKNQLADIIASSANVEYDQALTKRLSQASDYFQTEMEVINGLLKNVPFITESKEAAEELNVELQSLFEQTFAKIALFKSSSYGFNLHEFLKAKLKIVYPSIRVNVYENAKNAKISSDVIHPALYKKLLLLRDDICNEEQKPIYMVANNKALKELVEFLPTKSEELMKITGFGEARVEAFGEQFLNIIKDYLFEHDLESNMNAMPSKKEKKSKKEKEVGEKVKKVSSKEQTFKLFKEGLSLEEISIMRGFTVGTLESHLTPYITSGEINIDFLVSPDKQKTIMRALEKFDKAAGINPIKSSLPSDITFSEIKFVLALKKKEGN
ncbi:MAG: helix-turn-helix domain-containing protein [Bacteroidota bacterium]|nr:helix-turn-helix domain-containing protein [Bacteroidota bacterium]MDP3146562.1 helix-turn-helix domain-containing protein [Bacteroidota bacterium]